MGEEWKDRRKTLLEDVEGLVDDVNKRVRVAVLHGSEAAESVGENIREALKDSLGSVRSVRNSVVTVRVNKESLARLEDLVEAGIAGSRSEAAAFLIVEGIKARQGLFEKIEKKIDQIRDAREELRRLVDEEDDQPEG